MNQDEYFKHLALIVASSDDAIISKTLLGIITSWNPGAERLFGYSADEAIGRPMSMLFPIGTEHEELGILEKISRGELISHFQAKRRRKNGELIDVSVTISPIYDDQRCVVGASKIARNITEIKRQEEELRRYREHLEDLAEERANEIRAANKLLIQQQQFIATITDNLPGMVGYWDYARKLRYANPVYCRWLEIGIDEFEKGIELNSDNLPSMGNDYISRLESALCGTPHIFEIHCNSFGYMDCYYQVHFLPDNREGDINGVFVLMTDVTAVKKTALLLRESNAQLEAALIEAKTADSAKTQFLANMSHEIRTPMNSILGFLGLVLEGELSSHTRKQLSMAFRSAKTLLLLINDILDLSKLQSGKMEIEKSPFDLRQLIIGCIELTKMKADEKNLLVCVEYPDEMDILYLGDAMRIRQIIINLLGNAIKFTERGRITISVKPGRIQSSIELMVTDTGIGMSEYQVGRIFQPFVQADSSTTRRFGGTGLGVSICRQLAEAMGGRIWVESTENVGSTFHVELPLPTAPAGMVPMETGPTAEETTISPRRFRVLLVDDIAENIELANARLLGQGHEVMTARNGREAVALVAQNSFDIVLMDVHMPEMNGLDAARAIRMTEKAEGRAQLPIIALTASIMQEERWQCYCAGMNAVVGKPIEFPDLFRAMENAVADGRGQAIDGARHVSRPVKTMPIGATPGIALDIGLARWGDSIRYLAALNSFALKHRDAAHHLGQLAVSANWGAAHDYAHALKGLAGNLALSDVFPVVEAINRAVKDRSISDCVRATGPLAEAIAEVCRSIETMELRAESGPEPSRVARTNSDDNSTLSDADATALLDALNMDDPSAVEPLLDQIMDNNPDLTSRLRSLLSEYDFECARQLVKARRAGTKGP